MKPTCKKCEKFFDIVPKYVKVQHEKATGIVYYECPHCKEKYLSFVLDAKMDELIKKRQVLETRIYVARAKKFRRKTIDGYYVELKKVITEQEKHWEELKPIGEEILSNLGKESTDEKHNSETSG